MSCLYILVGHKCLSLGKLLEKFVQSRLSKHVLKSQIFSEIQSGYRPFHSTETATVNILNNLIVNMTTGCLSIMVSLDLSFAFDYVVHSKLLNRLQDEFGVSGRCLDWLRSYLEDRSQYVSMKDVKSEITSLKTGVPHGSVLGPLLFSVYTSPLSRLIASNDFSCHSYADHTTIYFCLKGDMT